MTRKQPEDPQLPRTLTKADVAQLFNVTTRTVTNWCARGCPVTDRAGKPSLFNAEEVRAWKAANDRSAPDNPLATAELIRKVTLAKRNELELAAERGLKDLDLGERIRAAKTNDDLVEISKEVGALLGSGALSPARGRAIQSLLAEARHNMKEHREVEGDQEPERIFMLTMEGAALARQFEGIISEDRRELVVAYVRAEFEADLMENPNVDLSRAGGDTVDEEAKVDPVPTLN